MKTIHTSALRMRKGPGVPSINSTEWRRGLGAGTSGTPDDADS